MGFASDLAGAREPQTKGKGRLCVPASRAPALQAHLAVGCWDGTVSVWQLPGTALQPTARLAPLFCVKVDASPVRRVLWHPAPVETAGEAQGQGGAARAAAAAPAAPGGGAGGAEEAPPPPPPPGWRCSPLTSLDALPQHQIMTVSQSGRLRVWDVR